MYVYKKVDGIDMLCYAVGFYDSENKFHTIRYRLYEKCAKIDSEILNSMDQETLKDFLPQYLNIQRLAPYSYKKVDHVWFAVGNYNAKNEWVVKRYHRSEEDAAKDVIALNIIHG